MSYMLASIGMPRGDVLYWWSGLKSPPVTGDLYYCRSNYTWSPPPTSGQSGCGTFNLIRDALPLVPLNPRFLMHVMVKIGSDHYDPSYGLKNPPGGDYLGFAKMAMYALDYYGEFITDFQDAEGRSSSYILC